MIVTLPRGVDHKLSPQLSPTCVIQCHSWKLLHPVLHDSKPYLVICILEILRCKDRHVIRSVSRLRKTYAGYSLCSDKT